MTSDLAVNDRAGVDSEMAAFNLLALDSCR